eukprot:Seg2587.3 transcript_id=Seg2587.3/GoldUCD/mRNA.D3Y31 product="pre-mRNA 3' end processing protein WDR33" protein_id=Seg2587.3/GoldUCD/D3Y31
MLTQAVPPQQPYKFFMSQPQTSGAQPQAANIVPQQRIPMAQPRMPMPNMYAPPFNQFKQINVPPPNMSMPPPAVPADPTNQQMPVMHHQGFYQNNQMLLDYEARRAQRKSMRRTVDYNASIMQQIKNRVWRKTSASVPPIQPDVLYYNELSSPKSIIENPVNAVTTRYVRTATNKIRCPIFSLSWTPEGRRLISGSSSGEFTLWGGLQFNFETVMQAHESAVRTMEWSHNDTWLLSADHSGSVKYWQSNMNNVKTLQAHNDPVRGVGFSPTDNKFATCSDDGTIKIWDFYRCQEERVLRGHGADVKCLNWHPSKGLLVTGSKDSQQPLKLWDPKSGTSLSTIHIHKSTVMDLQWNRNGDWLLTASRDHLIKVFDIRAMKEIQTFRGHKKEATAVDWHPCHESLFASGGSDGAIMFWNMGAMKEVGSMDHAHDAMIWSVRWHPLGHILASGSNDHTCKFWTRNRPGDKMKDKYNLNTNPLGDEDYGIPGIDMQFPSAEKLKEQLEAKHKTLQTARQSGFKLPNLQPENTASTDTLRADATPFAPKSISGFKIPKTGQGVDQASIFGKGLLPTPDKKFKLSPPPNSKGIFDPLNINPGFVMEALEVWINKRFPSDDGDRARKRGRRQENQGRKRFDNQEMFSNEAEFQSEQDDFQEDAEEFDEGPVWREPKRPLMQRPLLQGNSGPPMGQGPNQPRFRPPFPQGRGRPQGPSDNFQQFGPRPGMNSGPFHPNNGPPPGAPQGEDEEEEGAPWNEPQQEDSNFQRGFPNPRGRGRGGPMNIAMQRHGPPPQDYNMNASFQEGGMIPPDQNIRPAWQNRGRMQPHNDVDQEEEQQGDQNFVPPQRRGPHPLLLRGQPPNGPRRFPPPHDMRGGPPFNGRGPRLLRPRPPEGPPQEGFQNEQFMPSNMMRPKLRGLLENQGQGNEQDQWHGDRTPLGR